MEQRKKKKKVEEKEPTISFTPEYNNNSIAKYRYIKSATKKLY